MNTNAAELDASKYLTISEAAKRIRRAPVTLSHWIAQGKLRAETGLRHCQGRPLIEWSVFEAAFVERE